jgi:hypothetical protein
MRARLTVPPPEPAEERQVAETFAIEAPVIVAETRTSNGVPHVEGLRSVQATEIDGVAGGAARGADDGLGAGRATFVEGIGDGAAMTALACASATAVAGVGDDDASGIAEGVGFASGRIGALVVDGAVGAGVA